MAKQTSTPESKEQPAAMAKKPVSAPRLGESVRVLVAPGRTLRHPTTGTPMSHSVPTELKVDHRTLACLRDGDLIRQ